MRRPHLGRLLPRRVVRRAEGHVDAVGCGGGVCERDSHGESRPPVQRPRERVGAHGRVEGAEARRGGAGVDCNAHVEEGVARVALVDDGHSREVCVASDEALPVIVHEPRREHVDCAQHVTDGECVEQGSTTSEARSRLTLQHHERSVGGDAADLHAVAHVIRRDDEDEEKRVNETLNRWPERKAETCGGVKGSNR